MNRRFAVASGRRPVRAHRSGVNPALPPLPASAVEYWHSELQCSASSWTGQIGGRVLPAVNTPSVGTDGANFNGRVVAKSDDAAQNSWRGTGLTPLVGAGARPWTFAVMRFRTTANDQGSHGISGVGFTQAFQIGGGARRQLVITDGILAVLDAGPADTDVHRVKTWADGVNANVMIDGSAFSIAWVGSTPNPVTNAAIGTNVGSAAFASDANHAFVLVCSSRPTAPEEAALDAWAQAYWGAP